MYIFLNGKFIKKRVAKISVLDNGVLYGDGFYDTMRTYDGKILELDLHVERIFHSAKILGINIPYTAKKIKYLLNKTISLNRLKTGRVRITVTRGENGFNFLTCKKPTIFIVAERLVVDSSIYKLGVNSFTLHLDRSLPEIKMIGITSMIMAYRKIFPKGAYEAILLDKDGYVREGASTNVFAVFKNYVLTPKNKILKGLTRDRAIKILRGNGIKVVEKDFKKDKLLRADEIFLTNQPREIIPVVKLDGLKIGSGKVGDITKKVMLDYHNYTRNSF